MTPEEEVQFTEKLTKQFILIPKDRLYHCVGGALAFVVIAFGITIGTVISYLRSEPAEIARKRIVEIRAEVEKHYADLGVGTFLKANEPYQIQTTNGQYGLFVSRGKPANGTAIVLAEGRYWTWKFVPGSK